MVLYLYFTRRLGANEVGGNGALAMNMTRGALNVTKAYKYNVRYLRHVTQLEARSPEHCEQTNRELHDATLLEQHDRATHHEARSRHHELP